MNSIVIPLNRRHFGLHSMKKPFRNYECTETYFSCEGAVKKVAFLFIYFRNSIAEHLIKCLFRCLISPLPFYALIIEILF